MQTIAPLPAEQAEQLLARFDAGTRIIVLVEGEDDRDALREWFVEQRAELEFYDCGGISNLKPLLEELLKHSTLKRAYGITDRDFRSETEVEASQAEGSHLFILRRYALENYLLEPRPMWEVLKLRHPHISKDIPDERAMEQRLLELCRRLKSVTAANWIFFDENHRQYQSSGVTARLEYFSLGHELDRQVVLDRAAAQLQYDHNSCDTLLTTKEELIEQQLAQLAAAHQVIDGKRLLHWMHREEFKTGDEGYLRRLLVQENKRYGIHTDLTSLILDRILPTA